MEKNMPKKAIKPFITYSEQLNVLTQKKQLNISDLSYAEGKLHDIGYYSLIDGYKDIFYNPMTRTYEEGTNFTDIVALYEFDENLRSLGQTSKMYSFMLPSIKSKVSVHYGNITEKELTKLFNTFSTESLAPLC
ncbi:MAG: Abi family protein [Lachnospiraceae bacterium]|nr:Abi family protein [Lachnospiraceae bacterium]